MRLAGWLIFHVFASVLRSYSTALPMPSLPSRSVPAETTKREARSFRGAELIRPLEFAPPVI